MKDNQILPDLNDSPEDPTQYFFAFKQVAGININADQEALLFIEAGKVCSNAGNWDNALENFQKASERCESIEIKAESLKQMGHIESKRGEFENAFKSYEASLEILAFIGNLREVGNIHNSMGFNYFEIGEIDKAKEHYDKALQASRQCSDTKLTADVWNNLGILANSHGEIEEAVEYYKKSLDEYGAINDIHGIAQVNHNLAMSYVDKGEWKLAGEHYQRSMEMCLELKDLDFLSIIYANRAELALHLHDPYVAKLYCDKAFDIFNKTGNKIGLAESHKIYGSIYSDMQKWEYAKDSFQKGIEICDECKNLLTKAEIYYKMSLVHRENGNGKDEALSNLHKALDIYKLLNINNKVNEIDVEMRAIANN